MQQTSLDSKRYKDQAFPVYNRVINWEEIMFEYKENDLNFFVDVAFGMFAAHMCIGGYLSVDQGSANTYSTKVRTYHAFNNTMEYIKNSSEFSIKNAIKFLYYYEEYLDTGRMFNSLASSMIFQAIKTRFTGHLTSFERTFDMIKDSLSAEEKETLLEAHKITTREVKKLWKKISFVKTIIKNKLKQKNTQNFDIDILFHDKMPVYKPRQIN